MKHERIIHYCDHCGKPAIAFTRRTAYAGTEFENNSSYNECRDCYNMSNKRVFSQNISEEQKKANMALTDACLGAYDIICDLGDQLNAEGVKNLQPRWKRVWKTKHPVPNDFRLIVMSYTLLTNHSIDTTVTIMQAYNGDLHQIEMIFPNMTVADVGKHLLPHVKCVSGTQFCIRDASRLEVTDYECYLPHLVNKASQWPTAIGEAKKLMPWFLNIIDEDDATYNAIAPDIKLPVIKK